jgi:hypothetical protein
VTPREVTAADVTTLAAAAGLAIDPAYHEAIARHLAGLLAAAALLADFPLPEDVEPAAVFRP